MRIQQVKALRASNRWARVPVLEAVVEPPESTDSLPPLISTLLDRHATSASSPTPEARMALGLAVLTIDLQNNAGSPVSFFDCVCRPGQKECVLLIEYEEELLARECLDGALELCVSAAAREPARLDETVSRLRNRAIEVMLGPSTKGIVDAARRRNVPVMRLDASSLVQLGYGSAQRRIRAAETDQTGAVAEAIAQDKEVTKWVLESMGVPVPDGYPVRDRDHAWQIAERIGLPAVVKPRYGNQGRGVATNLNTADQVKTAYDVARREGQDVIVECHAPGADHRLLVVAGKLVAASRRSPPEVVGDGASTIRELVEAINRDPRRTGDHGTALSQIPLDDIALQVLAGQDFNPGSVPPEGQRVLLRRNANLSTGGTAADVTDLVHPSVAEHAVAAAAAVGLDVAGVDVIAQDIARPLAGQEGVVVEVNAAPGLRMHLSPSEGQPRDVGQAIVDSLFPSGLNGRIPIAAVTGTNGKTTVTRFVAHLLRKAGKYVGMTCTDGIYLNERRTFSDDCSGPISARLILLNPKVEAAVFETARGGILREGLGFDECSVAVVTNIADGDHLGQSGIETAEDLARVKSSIVRAVARDGAAVLNAADPLVAAMAEDCPGRIIFFAIDGLHPVIRQHRAGGGAAFFVENGSIVFGCHDRTEVLLGLDRIPMTFGGRVAFEVENALAAIAAGWALGLPADLLREAASAFSLDMNTVPGRMNVLPLRGGTVLFDYGHNAHAVRSLVACLDVFPHQHRSAVFSMAGDRKTSDIVHIGELLGDAFDRVILYESYTSRGLARGVTAQLITEGLRRGSRVREILEIEDPIEAARSALDSVGPGELLVLQPDSIDDSRQFVATYMSAAVSPPPDESRP